MGEFSIPPAPPFAWTWTPDGWCRLSRDGTRLEFGGDGPEPVWPPPLPPVPAWRRFVRRLFRREYPR